MIIMMGYCYVFSDRGNDNWLISYEKSDLEDSQREVMRNYNGFLF